MVESFLAGIHLFNQGEFWHAHEAWERCWRESSEPAATFYKGIIQTSAALVHWNRHNPSGLRRNWEKGRPKLVAVAPMMMGLDVCMLIADMDRFVVVGGCPPSISCMRYGV